MFRRVRDRDDPGLRGVVTAVLRTVRAGGHRDSDLQPETRRPLRGRPQPPFVPAAIYRIAVRALLSYAGGGDQVKHVVVIWMRLEGV